jgi:hypothetical protein
MRINVAANQGNDVLTAIVGIIVHEQTLRNQRRKVL